MLYFENTVLSKLVAAGMFDQLNSFTNINLL